MTDKSNNDDTASDDEIDPFEITLNDDHDAIDNETEQINEIYKNYANLCGCNFNTKRATIRQPCVRPYTKIKTRINIDDYLKNIKMMHDVKMGISALTCRNKSPLSVCKTKTNTFFRHNPTGEMSEWHRTWQSKFDSTEVRVGCRRADAVVNHIVLEFQYSPILKSEVDDRTFDYADLGYPDIYWMVCCDDVSVVCADSAYCIEFQKTKWKHTSFANCKHVFQQFRNMCFS